jgi:hypothetical protein
VLRNVAQVCGRGRVLLDNPSNGKGEMSFGTKNVKRLYTAREQQLQEKREDASWIYWELKSDRTTVAPNQLAILYFYMEMGMRRVY